MQARTATPADLSMPRWAHELVAREAEARGVTETQVVVDALAADERRAFDALLAEGYAEMEAAEAEGGAEWPDAPTVAGEATL